MASLEIESSLNPIANASLILAPYTIFAILAQWHAEKHMGQGSQVEYIVQPDKSTVFNILQASLIAIISAWAVMSVFFHTWLWTQLITRLLLIMHAPKGVWPSRIPSFALFMARSIHFSQVVSFIIVKSSSSRILFRRIVQSIRQSGKK